VDDGEETDIAKIAKEHDIRNPEKVLTGHKKET
jgi:hypothetical protein